MRKQGRNEKRKELNWRIKKLDKRNLKIKIKGN
jgi:hypothetical protein